MPNQDIRSMEEVVGFEASADSRLRSLESRRMPKLDVGLWKSVSALSWRLFRCL